MKGMTRVRGLGALGVAVCVVAQYSIVGHASANWSLVAGTMSEARELPQAVVLNDGRVLVIGGIRPGSASVAVDVWTEGTSTLARSTDPARTSIVGLAVGGHTIALTVDDGFGGTSTATVVVVVRDATAART
jgi:hypothetical protein